MSKENIAKNDLVVAINYSLSVDGKVIDSSTEDEPLEFLQGHGNIISGLEREILGMKIGDSKEVIVSPAEGYGETKEDAYMEVPTNQFPENIPVEVGTEIQIENEEGEPAYARIEKNENNMATLNFNHPLAGKELRFAIKIIAIRDPSEEEMTHGHVHHHDDEQ